MLNGAIRYATLWISTVHNLASKARVPYVTSEAADGFGNNIPSRSARYVRRGDTTVCSVVRMLSVPAAGPISTRIDHADIE